MLHFEDFLIRFEILESDVVMLLEQFLEGLLLLLVRFLELVELLGELLVPLLELLVDGLDLGDLLLLDTDLSLDFLLVLFLFLVQLGDKVL